MNALRQLLPAIFIVATFFAAKTSAGGNLQVRLIEYDNWSGTISEMGRCCDALACSCDHYFKLCVDVGQGTDSMQRCPLGNLTTGVFANKNKVQFGSTIEGGSANPLQFNFTRWNTNGMKLKIQVWDEDDGDDDFVDFLKVVYNATPSRNELESEWTRLVVTNRTSITVEIKSFCYPNWYGPRCDVFCAPPSGNTSQYDCDATTGKRRCRPGWTGNSCLTQINECASSPCLNDGTCIDIVNGFKCLCPRGLTGERCAMPVDHCSSNPCQGKGSRCVGDDDGYICHCSPGFTGPDCSVVDSNACGDKRCSAEGGTCNWNGTTSYECTCKPGWTGLSCNTNIDECSSSPCQGFNSRCEDLVNGYRCHCSPGLTGSDCTISDPEACGAVHCHADGGMCVWSSDVGYSCQCLPGWTGVSCNKTKSNCHDDDGDVCKNGGTCIDLGHSFRCLCEIGWIGETCSIDVDECESNPCEGEGSICQDLAGGYECHCSPGSAGSRCHIPDPDACGPERCYAVGGICHWDAPANYSCKCKPGFAGDQCTTHVDDCATNPCYGNGSLCEDVVDGFRCHCRPGLTGSQCDVVDPEACGPFRCSSEGGTCLLNSFYQYDCRCKWGWSGDECRTNVDECSSNPCRGRDSLCVDLVDGYRCQCSPGLTGPNCNVHNSDACGPVRCHEDGGICTWKPPYDYRCTCKDGWTGVECNVNIEERTSGCNCMMQRIYGKECLERCSIAGASTTELIFYGRLHQGDVSRVIDGLIDHVVLVDHVPSTNLSVVYNVRHCVNKYRKPITKFEYLLRRRDGRNAYVRYASADDVIEFLPYPVTTDDTQFCRLANDSSFEPVRLSKTSYALPMLVGGIAIFVAVLLALCFLTSRLYSQSKTPEKDKPDVEKPPTNISSNNEAVQQQQRTNICRRDEVGPVAVNSDAEQQLNRSDQDDYRGGDDVARRLTDERKSSVTTPIDNKSNIARSEDRADDEEDEIDDADAEQCPLREKPVVESNADRAVQPEAVEITNRRRSYGELPLEYREMFSDEDNDVEV